MNNSIKISIIIPAYNAEKTIGGCVNSLLTQDYTGDFEIIAVDDGSTDSTIDILRTFDRVRIVQQPNAGPAAARNAGFKASAGDIVCFTDADCRPQPDWLKKIHQHFCDYATEVLAGSYGIANPESLLACCVHQEIRYRHEHLMGITIEVFGSYNVAFRRGIFERLGGFDESYRHASGEDNDFSYRLRNQGVTILFDREVKVDHCHPVQVKRYLHEQFRHGFWRARLYRVHPLRAKGDGYTFFKDILEIPLAAGLIMLALSTLFGVSWKIVAEAFLLALVMESVFCFAYGLRDLKAVLFFAAVMLLRSFARMFGLLMGVIG